LRRKPVECSDDRVAERPLVHASFNNDPATIATNVSVCNFMIYENHSSMVPT
jgi:hypothetical protein